MKRVRKEEAAGAVGKRLDRDDWYELLVIARGRPMPWGAAPVLLREGPIGSQKVGNKK